ncbi:tetratricopeptide repeat protein [Streptomyces sp. NPDC057445]|uniref:tetratricopeptide repeat protein n=1 Tax=Streptomyces sp. NPDC057445 TaxID=3346136 RepID=UPI0036B9D033
MGSGLLSVLLAVAVNVATGGALPPTMAPLVPVAWPLVGALTVVTGWVAIRQSRSLRPPAGPGRADPAAPPPYATHDPAELPAPVPDFSGRTTSLCDLARLVDEGRRVIAVTGAPGLGKSALTVRLAHELRHRYPDGRLYADLGTGRGDPATPGAVLARLLGALGAPAEEQSGDTAALSARFRSRTAGHRILLLLDDAADAAQVRPLLPGGDLCLALITSRNALTDLPEATPHPLGTLSESEALALLAAVAGPGRIASEHRAALDVVHACGLLPLALRIAGARLRARPSWPVYELADRLADERSRLDELRVGDLAVRAGFEAGYDTLDAADRHLFRSLGAYPGSRLTTRIAAAAAGWGQLPAGEGLERLVDAQLLVPSGRDGYRLHDLIRLFAAERLERDTAPAERTAALERLLDAYTEDATEHGSHAWGGAEQATVSLLVRAGVREGLPARAHHLARTADRWLYDQPGQLPRLAMWTTLLDAARRAGNEAQAAHALRGMGAAYLYEGRYDQAIDHLRMAVAVQQRAATRAEQIKTRRLLGDALRRAGRYEQALREFRTALDDYRATGHAMGEAEVLSSLGALHLDRRRPDEAIACLEPAVATLALRVGSAGDVADAERGLGAAYAQARNFTPAERCLRSALARYRHHDRAVGEGWTLRELGYLDESRGAYARGAEHHRAALAVFARIGYGTGVAAVADAIGDNLLAQGDEAGADAEYRRSATVYADLGDHTREAEVRRKLSA